MDTRKIILYEKYFDFAEDLTNEQFGNVMRAIGNYFIKNDETAGDGLSDKEKMLYKVMEYEIKINFEKYAETCEKRRKSAIKGVEKRKRIEQMLTNAGNNKNININKNNNNNINKNNSAYDFDEIEQLEFKRRINI